MEDRFVFREIEHLLDKTKITHQITRTHARYKDVQEGNTITLIIMGHGRERYKETFTKSSKYSDPFKYVLDQQKTRHAVRIFSKAGKPKTCAWDYRLCTPSMSSQDVILALSRLFFEDAKDVNTFSLMTALSSYFRTLYPTMIDKISTNYRDHPEDKNPGSPGAEGYEERFHKFSRVLESIRENKFSQLKTIRHQKVFTIRPETKEIYEEHCERYYMEIIDIRIHSADDTIQELVGFLLDSFPLHTNLVENYYSMNADELQDYIRKFNQTMNNIYLLSINDYEKFFLIKFIYKLFFGQELLLSELVECFTILGMDTINIIDNTCRVSDEHQSIPTPEIEEGERIRRTRSNSRSNSNGGTKKQFKK